MESLCPICSAIVPQSKKAVGLLSEFHIVDVVSSACLYPAYFLIIQVVFFSFYANLTAFHYFTNSTCNNLYFVNSVLLLPCYKHSYEESKINFEN